MPTPKISENVRNSNNSPCIGRITVGLQKSIETVTVYILCGERYRSATAAELSCDLAAIRRTRPFESLWCSLARVAWRQNAKVSTTHRHCSDSSADLGTFHNGNWRRGNEGGGRACSRGEARDFGVGNRVWVYTGDALVHPQHRNLWTFFHTFRKFNDESYTFFSILAA